MGGRVSSVVSVWGLSFPYWNFHPRPPTAQDLVPEHAGSLFGLMNTAGAIPGFVGVYLTGFILHLSNGNWGAVFATTAVICFAGWLFYAIFGRGDRIS